MLRLCKSEVLDGEIENCNRKFRAACNLESQARDAPRGRNRHFKWLSGKTKFLKNKVAHEKKMRHLTCSCVKKYAKCSFF